MKVLLGFLVFWWYLICFNSDFAHKLSFEKEKCALQGYPKFTRSNGWIKKSTFWQCLIRVLALISNILIFWFTIQSCCIFFFFLPFLALKLVILHILQFFWIFGLCFDVWIGVGQNTVLIVSRRFFRPGDWVFLFENTAWCFHVVYMLFRCFRLFLILLAIWILTKLLV